MSLLTLLKPAAAPPPPTLGLRFTDSVNSGTSNVTVFQSTLPGTIIAGDVLYFQVFFNDNTNSFTISGVSGTGSPIDGPRDNAGANRSYLYRKVCDGSEAGQTLTATWGGAVGRGGMNVVVFQGGDSSTDLAAMIPFSDNTVDLTYDVQGFTPGADNCLVVQMSAIRYNLSTGPNLGTVTGWTEEKDINEGRAAAVNFGNVILSKQLIGQNGVPQSATSGTYSVNASEHSYTLIMAPAPVSGTNYNRTGTDTLSFSDAATQNSARSRTTSESLSLTDVPTRVVAAMRTTSESLSWSDTATQLRGVSRTATEAAGSQAFNVTMLATSPVAYWRVDEPSGTTMFDSSGNGHDGSYTGSPTLGNPGLLVGDTNAMLSLTGGNTKWASVPYGSWMNRANDIAFGLLFNTAASSLQYLLQRWDNTAATQVFGVDIGNTSGQVRGYVGTTSGNQILTTSGLNVLDGNTHMIVVVWRNSDTTLRIFVDGVQVATDPTATGTMRVPTSGDIGIGRRLGTSTNYLNGGGDEFFMGGALTAQQVADLWYSATHAPSGFSDSAVQSRDFPRTASESLSPSDSAARSITLSRTTSESLSFSDTAVKTAVDRPRTATETLSPSDAATRTITLARTTTETLSLTDTATRAVTYPRTASESLSLSDAAVRVLGKPRTATETLSLSDAAARTITLLRTSSETLSPSDAAVKAVDRPRTASESLSLSDTATRALAAARSTSESLSLSDAAVKAVDRPRTASETLSPSDTATRAITLGRSTSESLSFSDAAVKAVNRPRTASETLSLSDTATRTTALSRSSSESLSFSDTATQQQGVARTATESLSLSDAAVQTIGRMRTCSETLSLTDTPTRAVTLARATSETLSPSDTATRSTALSRTTSETLSESEDGTAAVTIDRTATDTLSPSDAATRLVSRSRTTSETLSLSEAAVQTIGRNRFASETLTLAFSDDFNRANGALGANWVLSNSAPTLSGNQVVGGTNSGVARWATAAVGNDGMYSQATYRGSTLVGVAVAISAYAASSTMPNTGTFYAFRQQNSGAGVALVQKNLSLGTYTVLASVAGVNLVNGDVIRLTYVNGVLTGLINGVRVITHTPSSPITGQYGVGIMHAAVDTGTAILDDWSGGNTNDTVVRTDALSRSTSESLSLSDAAVKAVARARSASESLVVTDVASRLLSLYRSASESNPTTDSGEALFGKIRTASEALSFSDTAVRGIQVSRSTSESLTFTDAADRTIILTRTTSETLSMSDAATQVNGPVRSGTENLSTSDAATRSITLNRTSTDTRTTTDTATRTYTTSRTASESLSFSDDAQRAVGFFRTGADASSVSDAAERVLGAIRSGTEDLFLIDSADRAVAYVRSGTETLELVEELKANLGLRAQGFDLLTLSEQLVVLVNGLSPGNPWIKIINGKPALRIARGVYEVL